MLRETASLSSFANLHAEQTAKAQEAAQQAEEAAHQAEEESSTTTVDVFRKRSTTSSLPK
jgi:hypothetical protein